MISDKTATWLNGESVLWHAPSPGINNIFLFGENTIIGEPGDGLGDGVSITGSGGIVLGGQASIDIYNAYGIIIPPQDIEGALVFGGYADVEQHITPGRTLVGEGGLLFSGSADITQVNSYVVTPSGGSVFSGSADIVHNKYKIVLGEGGLIFGGNSQVTQNKYLLLTPSGGSVFSGSAIITHNKLIPKPTMFTVM